MADAIGKWGMAKRLGAAATAALMGGICSIVVSTGLLAGIELVPNEEGEKKPEKFCRYQVQTTSGDDCEDAGIIGGQELCTQCPNDAQKKKCRPNSFKMLNIKLRDGNRDCTVALKTISEVCQDCEDRVTFYWLEEN